MGSVIPLTSPIRLAPRREKLRIVANKPRAAKVAARPRVRSSLNTRAAITVPVAVITPR
ncbi:hypothetical protein N9E53_05605 [Amylibacter sp.]|nr:hypothetical protein [Amylibacter sp.]